MTQEQGRTRRSVDQSTATTVQNIGSPCSPKHASEGEKRDNEGVSVVATPGDFDDEKDEASLLSPSNYGSGSPSISNDDEDANSNSPPPTLSPLPLPTTCNGLK